MAFDRTKPADTDYISASAANLRENFRALAEDTRLYGTGSPESSAGQNGWRYVDTATGDEYLKVNNAWIKKTDLADLIRGLFLGTVSEDEGVPTGAIIESGSNANGEYIKFANGTMICQKSATTGDITTAWGTLYQSNASSTGTFPAAFIDKPYCNMMWIQGGGGLSIPAMYEASWSETTGPQIALVRPTSLASGGTVYISAIGRWF